MLYTREHTAKPTNPPANFNEWMNYITDTLYPFVPIKEIVLPYYIMTVRTITRTLTEGEMICLENEKLVDCKDRATHTITSIHERTNGKDRHIVVMDMKTFELKRFYI